MWPRHCAKTAYAEPYRASRFSIALYNCGQIWQLAQQSTSNLYFSNYLKPSPLTSGRVPAIRF